MYKLKSIFNQICISIILLISSLVGSTVHAQFNYELYHGSYTNLPDFSSLQPVATGQTAIIDTSPRIQNTNYALVFTNQLQVTIPATYEFRLTSDDGSKLYIDNQLVVDNDGKHAIQTVQNTISLAAGSYDLRVEYFQSNTIKQQITVHYRVAGGIFNPIPADGQLNGNIPTKAQLGEWGSVIPWPHVAISAANLPDGRVLTWSSTETDAFPSNTEYTHAAVFNPGDNTFITTDSNFHDMFCAGVSTLEDGTIVASGGNPHDNRTSMFDPQTLTWAPLSPMFDNRWYATNVTLPNNQIFSSFGLQAGNRSEKFDPVSNSWIRTPNASMQTLLNEHNDHIDNDGDSQWWAHLAVQPDGKVFHGGPNQTFHIFDPVGGVSEQSLGLLTGNRFRMWGNAVTYDVGKVMLVGGSDMTTNQHTIVENVYLVDLNGAAPVVTTGSSLNYPRALSNSVSLPNGEVIIIGGNTTGYLFEDDDAIYPSEIYNPQSDTWRVVDSIDIPRTYHSTALLMKDGRVLSTGGGACGDDCGVNHLDGQIYSPPYLFNDDDTLATRPLLSGVPSQAGAANSFDVNASIDTQSFSMVRLSATTHHMNTDQRFIPVPSINNGDGTFTLFLNSNPNVLIAGNYWLFAVNSNGTPSMGETIQIKRDLAVTPPGDSDNDGVPDNEDAFPNDPTETSDSDNDGVGDNSDAFPNDPTETLDSDGDGIGDNSDPTPFGEVNVTPLPEAPRNSTTLIVEDSTGSDRIWNVNPDNNSVSVSSASGTLIQEIVVGDKPWSLAKQPNANRIYVTNKADATISIIDTQSRLLIQTIGLPYASQPHGIVFNTLGTEYFLVLEATATVQKRSSVDHQVLAETLLSGAPRHIAITFDDARLFVSNFITPPIPGESTAVVDVANGNAEVFSINPASMTLVGTVALNYDNRAISEFKGPGMPNYINAPVISFDNSFAYLPSKKDNIAAGVLRGNMGMTFDQTVRAHTSKIIISTETEDLSAIDFDNASLATGAALTGESRYLLVALETSRELAVYDTVNNFELMRLPTGRAPQGVALSTDGATAYVHNFMDRSISRFDLTEMINNNLPATNILSTINVVTNETLTTEIFLGKQLFYDAGDDRLARDNYMSCASCHNDGDGDGRVWDFTAFGEGLRNTIDLRGRAADGHGFMHWSANFDELQDFEGQIRAFAGGTGLMSDADFNMGTRSQPLGDTKAGVSTDLDALAAYVNSLNEFSLSPYRNQDGTLSSSAQAGKQVFIIQNCASCHFDSNYTNSLDETTLSDIGTIKTSSGNRLGSTLNGIDVPTLRDVWKTAPYLHDGSALTLVDAVLAHDSVNIDTLDLVNLVSYLNEIGSEEALAPEPDSDNDGVIDRLDAFPNDPTETVDSDNDGVGDNADAFPNDPTETADSDNDGVGDNADAFPNDPTETVDSDNDGVGDNADAFPNDPTETVDSDNDGVGDNADAFPNDPTETVDSDNDGVGDNADAFPNDPTETADSDNDGVGDNADAFPNDPTETVDSDNDGVGDNADAFPNDPTETVDSDNDGVGDNADTFPNDPTETADSDNDGVGDNADAFPNDPTETADSDNDGVGDNADAFPNDPTETADSDNDGVGDNADAFPNDPTETADSDNDGVGDNADAFPNDPTETVDSDNDGVGDNADAFPNDPTETADSDNDGVGDNADAFPNDPTETVDSDNDGVGDNADAFPNDPTETVDSDNDGVGDNADPFPNDPNNSVSPKITSPTEGVTLTDSSVTVTWVQGTGANGWAVRAGTTGAGSYDLALPPTVGAGATSQTITGLPTDGSNFTISLYGLVNGSWIVVDSIPVTAHTDTTPTNDPNITSPSDGATLTSDSATVTWDQGTGANGWAVRAGTTGAGSYDLALPPTMGAGATSQTITGLPTDGSNFTISLYCLVDGSWIVVDSIPVTAFTDTTPTNDPNITSPSDGATLTSDSATVTWDQGTGANGWAVRAGTTGAGSYDLALPPTVGAGATSQTITGLPTDGSNFTISLYGLVNGSWIVVDSIPVTAHTDTTPTNDPNITSPSDGATLTSDSATVTWDQGTGANGWAVRAGTTGAGSYDLALPPTMGAGATSQTITGLPTDGSNFTISLYGLVNGSWIVVDSIPVTAHTDTTPTNDPNITSPSDGATLTSDSATVTWDQGTGANGWAVRAGTTGAGSYDLALPPTVGAGATSQTITGLPTDGSNFTISLYGLVNGSWIVVDSIPVTAHTDTTPTNDPNITSPSDGATLTSDSATVTWDQGTGANGWAVRAGTTGAGSYDLALPPTVGAGATSQTITGLPTDGSNFTISLYGLVNGSWIVVDSIPVTAHTDTTPTNDPNITSPSDGATLTSDSATVTWDQGTGANGWAVRAGTTGAGSYDLALPPTVGAGATSQTITGLPTDGSNFTISLYGLVNGSWIVVDSIPVTAYTGPAPSNPDITFPAENATLTDSSVTVTWDQGTGANGWAVRAGTTGAGSYDLALPPTVGAGATSQTITGLPTDGSNFTISLYGLVNGSWIVVDSISVTAADWISGVFPVTGNFVETNCQDPADNGTSVITGTYTSSAQSGGNYTGTLSIATVDGLALSTAGVSATGFFTGTHLQTTASGNYTLDGQSSGVIISRNQGTFNASLAGDTISINMNGMDTIGDTCSLTGTLSGNR